jgi:hypothetical protein|nr:MBL fold metallo-hydrolase [uncultured Lachnoanaerobaculum sp.]
MKLLKKILMASLCSLMIASTSITAYAGVVGKSSSRYPKVVEGATTAADTYLNGAEIHMLSSSTRSQMMSFVIKTKNGKLIVVDGGLPEDAPHLVETIKSFGTEVSAWILSHPHSDHGGAFAKIAENGFEGLQINAFYYNIREQAWYDKFESHRAGMVNTIRNAIAKLPAGVSHMTSKGEVYYVDGVAIHVLNNPYWIESNSINNSSVVFRLDFDNGTRVLFLGDMGPQAGESLKAEVPASELKADIVQMAHHGQYGVNKDVYELIAPKVAMWNAPGWLWDNDGGSGYNTGNYKTLEVRAWMDEIGTKTNYVIKDGDQTIK